MFITKTSLSRRTFLRGAGFTVALPFLEAMVPALTATVKTAAQPTRRFGAIYIPHGAIMDQWTPATLGTGFDFTPILKPLEAFKDHTIIVSNLMRPGGESTNTHVATAAGWLSGAIAKPTEGEDIYLVDQAFAYDRPPPPPGKRHIIKILEGGMDGKMLDLERW